MTGAPADARTRPRRRPTPASLGNVYEKRYHETVISVAISADDSFIVSCSEDKMLRVWDMATGALKVTLETPEPRG